MSSYRSVEDELVTGEAVAIELPPATVGLRLGAGVVDVLVTYLVWIPVLFISIWAVSQAPVEDLPNLFAIAVIGGTVFNFLIIPTTIGTLTRGKSLGKWMFGLRVVRDDGGTISFHHAFVRSLIGVVEIYLFTGGPAFLASMLSKSGKRLGDRAAGTYVVRDRFQLVPQVRREMPPQLAGWAGRADVAPIPTTLTVAVRQFLQRAPSLDPVTRSTLAVDLANRVAPYVSPAPPPHTMPEAWLAAVMVIRRDKDAELLARGAQLRERLVTRSSQPADAG